MAFCWRQQNEMLAIVAVKKNNNCGCLMCHLKYYETGVSGSAMRKLLKHISQQTSEVASYTHLSKDFNSHFIPVHLIRHC